MQPIHRRMPVLLSYAFRPFFLLAGVYAVLLIVAWVGFLVVGWPLPLNMSPVYWHSHEMLYGLVPAAIAGFILTAMTNWTQDRPLQGRGLLLLILLWLAGRLAMWCSSWLPAMVVTVVDMMFLPILAAYVATVLVRQRNHRNLVLVLVIALLAAGNLQMHLGLVNASAKWLTRGQLHGFDLITVLMLVIGGRIIPTFTANWLRANGGNSEAVRRTDLTDRIALASAMILLPLDWVDVPIALVGAVALVAGATNLVRLLGWAGWRVMAEPLLWILHLAYGWIVLALLLRGISAFSSVIPATVWQHVLGLGGIATLILGVMTRVAVGHTGRALVLPRYALVIYVAIQLATVLRVSVALQWLGFRIGISLAAGFWVLAFGLFVLLYFPILARPRADGRPG